MFQFPLVLALEPKLLPYARANGFAMDRKVGNPPQFADTLEHSNPETGF